MMMESAVDEILDALLECIVNTEYRKMCYEFDDFSQQFKLDIMYSGSFVEGVKNFNDIDVMLLSRDFIAVNYVNDIPRDSYNLAVFMIESKGCHPGYVRLQFFPLSHVINFPSHWMNGLHYFNSKEWLSALQEEERNIHSTTLHGPALKHATKNQDQVPSLSILSWPSNCKGFLKRVSEIAGKLSINKQRIRDIGCHLVPVSHPLSKEPDVEFRISFSACEKYLLRNWTNKQMRCYFLCRELNKKCFSGLEKRICSYFWKTTILWLIEVKSKTFWSQPYLDCMKKILDKMSCYLKEKSCPNYFVPDNLMMSTYTTEQCEQLQKNIEDVSKNLFLHILKCPYIRELFEDVKFEMMYSICEVICLADNAVAMNDVLNSVTVQNNGKFVRCKDIDLYTYQCAYVTHATGMLITFYKQNQFLRTFPDREHSQFEKCLYVYLNRFQAFFVLEQSDSISSSEESQRLLHDALVLLNSSIHLPGILDDYGYSGYIWKALFCYCISNKEMFQESMMLCDLSMERLPHDFLARSITLPICVYSSYCCKTPSYLKKDKILCDIFEELHGGEIYFHAFVLFLYLQYQSDGDECLLKYMKEFSEIANDESQKLIQDSYLFLSHKLGLLDSNSDEYIKFTQPRVCPYRKCN